MSENTVGEFNDFETDPDDSETLGAYIEEVKAAVEAFGVEVKEPGHIRGPKSRFV